MAIGQRLITSAMVSPLLAALLWVGAVMTP